MKARLETNDGHFVVDLEVPPFALWPDVIVWGDRFFRPHSMVRGEGAPWTYRECFAYVAPAIAP